MKKIWVLCTFALLVAIVTACGGTVQPMPTPVPQVTIPVSEWPNPDTGTGASQEEKSTVGVDNTKILVAYFSCTGTTQALAEYIADALGADLYEIAPKTAYSAEDLNYDNSASRSNREQNDPAARPAMSDTVSNMEAYDVVFLGYPLWWGQAPRIISTFLESYDFSGKTIVPFCTSHSSGVGSSDSNLHDLCSNSANWISGTRFAADTSSAQIDNWISGFNLELNAKQSD